MGTSEDVSYGLVWMLTDWARCGLSIVLIILTVCVP